MTIKICSWNINGLQRKFANDNVLNILKTFDIVVISETKFGDRVTCPNGFVYVGRSIKIESKSPRGGVAVYRNINTDIQIDCLYDGFRDCLIFRIRDSDAIFAAIYIPPANSIYFDEIYFHNLEVIYEKFKDFHLFIMGDVNSRIGTPESTNMANLYVNNPDTIINDNGKKLLSWLNDHRDITILNGLLSNGLKCDSKFTFYRGSRKSQNDYVMTNSTKGITFFRKIYLL